MHVASADVRQSPPGTHRSVRTQALLQLGSPTQSDREPTQNEETLVVNPKYGNTTKTLQAEKSGGTMVCLARETAFIGSFFQFQTFNVLKPQ